MICFETFILKNVTAISNEYRVSNLIYGTIIHPKFERNSYCSNLSFSHFLYLMFMI